MLLHIFYQSSWPLFTPNSSNPHSRKSSKKVSYFRVFLLSSFTHCYTMLWWADGSIFIRIIHFWNNDNNFMGRPPPTGLDPTDRTASYGALSKRARLIAIPRITAVRVNCWCPLEFDICQSLAIVGGCCCWCFCVMGNFSWGNNDLIKMTNNIFCGQFSWDIAKMPMLIHTKHTAIMKTNSDVLLHFPKKQRHPLSFPIALII